MHEIFILQATSWLASIPKEPGLQHTRGKDKNTFERTQLIRISKNKKLIEKNCNKTLAKDTPLT
jgi:hypothetical protein